MIFANEFQGKTALITGGTTGIGRVTAVKLAEAGAHVVITGRRAEQGAAAAKEIQDAAARAGHRAVKGVFVQGDITDEAHIARAVAASKELTGKLDFAFNNAGVELGGVPTTEGTAAQFDQVFKVNVLGVLLSMKHQIPAMAAGGGGSIVNNASIAGSVGMPGAGIYIASKHAVLGLTRSAAMETARSGIRINAVSPAAIQTEMFDRFTGGAQPDTVKFMESLHPMGRIGKPGEIAGPVLFLFSSASSFMTGHDLKVDGGFTVQ